MVDEFWDADKTKRRGKKNGYTSIAVHGHCTLSPNKCEMPETRINVSKEVPLTWRYIPFFYLYGKDWLANSKRTKWKQMRPHGITRCRYHICAKYELMLARWSFAHHWFNLQLKWRCQHSVALRRTNSSLHKQIRICEDPLNGGWKSGNRQHTRMFCDFADMATAT